ncbi:2-succinyl-5-enolpyruvyl-6-hydroxy-3-cyclohexene-1-carboxylate synthase [Saonia flava]|uniref:2-succinyl-5-enolpyruvyl-6-hydroxy-3-cyclohexene-1-carboxylate synthase n=1 Tax=Saonia flava TaxID=523696 RepID=A0A846QL15_9FLAO|nr:2-succinyl-5-enolpyruvyl-6-hydroxy-3-cyclohexene-1-carboxylic-acid synthase [Saonia flava]NJB69646.1 2-succinyl-5-enolpyruvyl-6-hydroxy-3-cyclohexene-1-carboxylate synthase [Saonia flava]
MKYSSIPSAQTVVHHCKANNIKNIVISPGSRNAPLTIGFTKDSFFRCFSIVDERCAGFFALGMSQNIQEPVILVCTSGSALLNYYPAIAEAFYSDIPLVVISADRPNHKIDIGDGQTIRQENVFQNHIGYSANLKLDILHATEKLKKENNALFSNLENSLAGQEQVQSYNDNELNRALNIAIGDNSPVHINVPFEEPLYDLVENSTVTPLVVLREIGKKTVETDFKEYAQIWNSSVKKMVLVGASPPNSMEQQFLDELAEDTSLLIFTETTSNLHHPNLFPSIDSIIAPIEKSSEKEKLFKELQPDILLTFGGLIVSKKIKAFLRRYKPKNHWHVGTKKAYNTFFSLTHHFKMDVNSFFNSFLDVAHSMDSEYLEHWLEIKKKYVARRSEYLSKIPFSDLFVFNDLIKCIPNGYQVQLANSSTVRYTQLFDFKSSLHVFCNRGTSGIDGSTSTAIGSSIYNEAPTLLITGDLSFFYDSNGLWNNYILPTFRILLINNEGGGIFRILPGKEDTEEYRNYFETSHKLNASHLAKMYGFEYILAWDDNSLNTALSTFYEKSSSPKLLEIKTPRLLNDKILLSYFDFIS